MHRLKQLRESRDLKQWQIANIIGMSRSGYANIENGNRDIDNQILKLLCEFYDMSAGYILGIEEKLKQNIIMAGRCVRINVYTKIQAGIPIDAIEDIVDFELLPVEAVSGSREYIAIRVSGNSMLPKYQDQDTVIIRLQSECETGQDCAVFVNGNDLTLLKVVKQIDGILLQPFNPNYDPKFYPYDHNNESVKILGVIVEMRRKFI